jgi:hypothetical protein
MTGEIARRAWFEPTRVDKPHDLLGAVTIGRIDPLLDLSDRQVT